jgi:prepilin-type N-terminal cleavage/methylation domain-containing protein
MLNKKPAKQAKKNSRTIENGFTLLEVVVAILILTIGLIGTATAITYALQFSTLSKNLTSAKLIIVSSIEEIESLRNTQQLGYKQIENAGKVDNTYSPNFFTGFTTDFQPISTNPGPDGVNGTADDLRDAGADKKYGTADDFENPALARGGYSRQIEITNLAGTTTLKKIQIKVRYPASNGAIGEIRGVSYLNDEARVTR